MDQRKAWINRSWHGLETDKELMEAGMDQRLAWINGGWNGLETGMD